MDGTRGGFFRHGLMASVAIVCAATATPAVAQTRSFNVSEQDAASGVAAFAKQADIQLLISARDANGKRTNAVRGNLTVEQGLQRLLADTGLRAQSTGAQTYSVVPSTVGNGPAAAEAASSGNDAVPEGQEGIAEILVVGSRSQNVDIRRTENDAQPYVVFKGEDIQKSGANNLEEFLRSRLPMNSSVGSLAQVSGAGTSEAPASNLSSIDLRGLGSAQTLILVDGRRAPRVSGVASGTNLDPSFGQADINGIPISAIERIEVLPSTAGGIYGGGAVGGVINIIKKRKYNGLDLLMGYDGTFRGGGETFRIELNGGFNLEHGRTQVSFALSHAASDPLYAKDNDLRQRGVDLLNQTSPNDAQSIPNGLTTNIRGNDVFDFLQPGCGVNGNFTPCFVPANLRFRPQYGGAVLNSNHVSIPSGYDGLLIDGPGPFGAMAGEYNTSLSNDALGRFARLRNNPRVRSASLNIIRSFTENLDIFGDFSISENLGRSSSVGISSGIITLPGGVGSNPFLQTITVKYPVTGVDKPVLNKSHVLDGRVGFIFKLGHGWTATAEYDHSKSKNHTSYTNVPIDPSIDAAIRSGAIDIFRDLNEHPIDFSAYRREGPDSFEKYSTIQKIGSGRISGPILTLPAGPLTTTALIEYRDEVAPTFDRKLTSAFLGNITQTTTVFPRRSQNVFSLYQEVAVPIFSERNEVPFFRLMDVQASIRYDKYSTSIPDPSSYNAGTPPDIQKVRSKFHSVDFTLGSRWAPVHGLIVRGSYSTGFLPPSISQVTAKQINGLAQGTSLGPDPLRNNQPTGFTGPWQVASRGNSELKPEESRSFSAGAILTILPGTRLSFDYTQIKKTDEILSPDFLDILAHEDLYPGRVVRGPNLPTDPPGWAGPIQLLDFSFINLAKSKSKSLDFQADYDLNSAHFGKFHFYVVATRAIQLKQQVTPESQPYDKVGFVTGPLKWRGNAGLDWASGNWDVGINAQYYDGYSVKTASGTAATNDIFVARQGSSHIPSQWYSDITVRYHFGEDVPVFLRGSNVTLGIQNMFDHKPPVIASTGGGYSLYGDPRLRRFFIRVGRHF